MALTDHFGLAAALVVRRAVVWICVAGWSAAALQAQDEAPTLHVYPNLVQIPTLVLDRNERLVAPIAEDRFFVSIDSGPKFRVTDVRPEGDDPISLAIVLDVSQPSPRLMAKIDEAIAGLAPLSLRAKDRVSLYSMGCHLGRSGENVPADAARLHRDVDVVLEQWKTHGTGRSKSECKQPANLRDSLLVVTKALGEQAGRRVMLVVTDGEDRGSKTSWNGLRMFAQEQGVAIFGMVQLMDTDVGHNGQRNPEDIFQSVCEETGGMVLTASERSLAYELKQFTETVRARYIVEFPHPVDTKGGYHDMKITIANSNARIMPAGIGVPKDNPAILNDPTTVPLDPADAPQLGKRKVISPH
jgi:VWFA-related protein